MRNSLQQSRLSATHIPTPGIDAGEPMETMMMMMEPDMVQPVETHEAYRDNLRYQMQDWTPAELAIHEAMRAVEEAGGSPHLTNATRLLSQARQAVARHVLS